MSRPLPSLGFILFLATAAATAEFTLPGQPMKVSGAGKHSLRSRR